MKNTKIKNTRKKQSFELFVLKKHVSSGVYKEMFKKTKKVVKAPFFENRFSSKSSCFSIIVEFLSPLNDPSNVSYFKRAKNSEKSSENSEKSKSLEHFFFSYFTTRFSGQKVPFFALYLPSLF